MALVCRCYMSELIVGSRLISVWCGTRSSGAVVGILHVALLPRVI